MYEKLPTEQIHQLVVAFFAQFAQKDAYYLALDGLKHWQDRDDVSNETRRAIYEAREYLTDEEWHAIINVVQAFWRESFIEGLNQRLYRSTYLKP